MGTILFILFVVLLLIGLFREIAYEHDKKLLEISFHVSKKQKIKLIKKAYFNTTKKEIRENLNKTNERI